MLASATQVSLPSSTDGSYATLHALSNLHAYMSHTVKHYCRHLQNVLMCAFMYDSYGTAFTRTLPNIRRLSSARFDSIGVVNVCWLAK